MSLFTAAIRGRRGCIGYVGGQLNANMPRVTETANSLTRNRSVGFDIAIDSRWNNRRVKLTPSHQDLPPAVWRMFNIWPRVAACSS